MTQPIQEPSHDRAMQGANWGVRQLFRRPAAPVFSWQAIWALTAWYDGYTFTTDELFEPDQWDDFYISEDAMNLELFSPTDPNAGNPVVLNGWTSGTPSTYITNGGTVTDRGGVFLHEVQSEWVVDNVAGTGAWLSAASYLNVQANPLYIQPYVPLWQPSGPLGTWSSSHELDVSRLALLEPDDFYTSFNTDFIVTEHASAGGDPDLTVVYNIVVKLLPWTGDGEWIVAS